MIAHEKLWRTSLTLRVIVFIGAVVLATVTAHLIAARQSARGREDRTTPLLTQMNERQRAHSRAHGPFKTTTRPLDELLSVHIIGEPTPSPDVASPDVEFETLENAKCETDAAVVGIIENAQSFPTEDGTFLFTDYVVRLNDVLRAGGEQPLSRDGSIVLTRAGGTISIAGKRVSAYANDLPPLYVGATYLLFVRHLPATKDFIDNDANGAFRSISGRYINARTFTAQDVRNGAGQSKEATENVVLAKTCK
jgi:hypothetical protein